MVGRSALGIAVAACFLMTGSSLHAQGPTPLMGPLAVGPSPNSGSIAYGSPPGNPAVFAPASQDWVGGSGGPPPQTNPYVDSNGVTTNCYDGTATAAAQSDELDQTPVESCLCRAARNAIFTLSYINWNISAPHNTLIGSQPSLQTMNPNFGNSFFGQAITKDARQGFFLGDNFVKEFDTSPVTMNNNSGIQGTIAIPMTYGAFEFGGFILQPSVAPINPGFVPFGNSPNQNLAAIGLSLPDGTTTDKLLLYSYSFNAEFRSFVFGGEANFVFNGPLPKDYGFVWMPMFGYRYLGIDEQFEVTGVNPPAAFASTINSRTINNIHGPQIGMRFEFVSKWITLGAEPKVAFAVNQFSAGVTSFDPSIGGRTDQTVSTAFSPIGSLNAYGKIPLTDHFRLVAGYNLIGVANISRPNEQIVYAATAAGQNDIHLNLQRSGILIQGFNVGAEFQF